MANLNDEMARFARWLRMRREVCHLTEEEAAALLGVSVAIYIMWEVRGRHWAALPAEWKIKFEGVFGQFQATEEPGVPKHQEFRQAAGTAYADRIEKEIEKLDRGEPSQELQKTRRDSSSFNSNSEGSYIETMCAKCSAPVLGNDNGRCSNCGRAVDQGH